MNFKEKVLNHFNIDNELLNELLKPIDKLCYGSPYDFYNMKEAKSLIEESINKDYKVMVYGDYDVDGIMATSIIINLYKKFNKTIGYYIPSRKLDGYGISLEKAKMIVEKGYDLVITVDNGVKQFEALNYLKNNGVKVLLSDHHEFDEIPPCDVFIHPFNKIVKEENCGAYVAYMLTEAVLNKRDDYLLSLVSLATISDMMPLNILNNRNIVRIGIDIVNKNINHPFRKLSLKEINDESYGFIISPKINSYGRVIENTSINGIIPLFIEPFNNEKSYSIINSLEKTNLLRKELIKEESKTEIIYNDNAVVTYDPNYKDGLLALFCNKYLNKYKKPCIAFTDIDENELKGSARSFQGASLTDFFKENEDLFIKYGGHAFAGGISIKKRDLNELIKRFNLFVLNNPYEEKKIDPIFIDKEDITLDNYNFLNSLRPFGMNYEEPCFELLIDKTEIKIYEKCIKANLNEFSSLIGFDVNNYVYKDSNNIIGKIKKDEYNKNKLLFYVSEINSK